MAGSICKSEKYLLFGLISALLIGTTFGSPLPQEDDFTNEIDQKTSSTTTESLLHDIAKLYTQPTSKMHNMVFAGGVHKFNVGPGENEDERALEEYRYAFERVEKNLPPTTTKRYLRTRY